MGLSQMAKITGILLDDRSARMRAARVTVVVPCVCVCTVTSERSVFS